MVEMYNEFYDLDVVKRTKDLVDLPHDIIVKNFNILYGNDISDLAEGSVVMVTDIKLKTLGFFRKNKDEDKFIIKRGKANWDVVFMDVTSHTGLDFNTPEYFKEDEVEEDVDVVNNPSHYKNGDIEVIEYIEQQAKVMYESGTVPPEVIPHICNAIKYISRFQSKGKAVEDLNKSIYYINRAIKNIEGSKE